MDLEKNILDELKNQSEEQRESDMEAIQEHVNKTRWRTHETSLMFQMHNKYTKINEYGQHCPPCRAKVQKRCRLILDVYRKNYGQEEGK